MSGRDGRNNDPVTKTKKIEIIYIYIYAEISLCSRYLPAPGPEVLPAVGAASTIDCFPNAGCFDRAPLVSGW